MTRWAGLATLANYILPLTIALLIIAMSLGVRYYYSGINYTAKNRWLF